MEFRARPNTTVLNEQQVELGDEYHGTIVASIRGSADRQRRRRRRLPAGRAPGVRPLVPLGVADVQGISRATAARAGVINLSLGGDEPSRSMYEAIVNAFGRGSIVVAAAGNERLRE